MNNGITDEHIKHARLYIKAREIDDPDKPNYEKVLHSLCSSDAVFAKAMLRAKDLMDKERLEAEGAA